MDMGSPDGDRAWHLCPWNQTLPFVLRAAPQLTEGAEKFLIPTLHFQLGPAHVRGALRDSFASLGISRRRSDAAVDAAFAAQDLFQQRLLGAGREALAALERSAEPAVILVGRPYNLYDRNSNCDIPRKLRSLYGVNVLPLDFLPLDDQPVDSFADNLYWYSGRRILAAGLFARLRERVHLIYITNFKCGPDSFVKHFMRSAAGSPFLLLQFDGHGNDAGYLTRCEAYLDSKGVLRCDSAAQAQKN
jgi:predicted nucleotide-binding protein (sugar kinase/HSP70/actin superfamily)